MSGYGLKIYRDDGSLFISPDVTPMNYVGKYRYTGNGTIQLDIPDTASIMPFLRNDDVNGATHLTWTVSGGKWWINVNTTGAGWVYVFATIVTVEHGYGLAVYDSNGKMTWNTDCLPLDINATPNPWNGAPINSSTVKIDVDVGLPAAIMPGICSNYLLILSSSEHIYIYGSMVARAYGNIVGAHVWDGTQINSQPPSPRFRKDFIYIDTRLYP
ncbi:hypothetical protein [Kluyvera cryocrescens]|uniref:hypothetical protein n=1 Tax=Kluyvera cryocrescens TaxID=580 RepID=UPI0007736733|nr:hypothetical protein [Kluyvera cryocrescens]